MGILKLPGIETLKTVSIISWSHTSHLAVIQRLWLNSKMRGEGSVGASTGL